MLALQTPRNKKDGRGIWLLNHQHQHHITQAQLGGAAAYTNPLMKVSEAAEGQELPAKSGEKWSTQSTPQGEPPRHATKERRQSVTALSSSDISAPPMNGSDAAFHSPESCTGCEDPQLPQVPSQTFLQVELQLKRFQQQGFSF